MFNRKPIDTVRSMVGGTSFIRVDVEVTAAVDREETWRPCSAGRKFQPAIEQQYTLFSQLDTLENRFDFFIDQTLQQGLPRTYRTIL
jgi:hypothetical protein